ncbi:hypothetical protein ABTL79_19180, partial [Acinetobacter baumannii]
TTVNFSHVIDVAAHMQKAAPIGGLLVSVETAKCCPGGLGAVSEERLEVHQVMDDMRSAGIDFLTMGQYLQPTPKHAKVIDFVTPKAFAAFG